MGLGEQQARGCPIEEDEETAYGDRRFVCSPVASSPGIVRPADTLKHTAQCSANKAQIRSSRELRERMI
ncbi:hypothetical protein E2562_002712 [Oryza meyeriana var. granulata]|uniref:Uncharacterized protein n=1 Tax=Oryza meyeriana var. granulata TaxID=110450 RepID=A0A6G1BQR1_9ORYZ|nr:hypothetical protein E2562_002712 [Oryza meyeriana var. granulata]